MKSILITAIFLVIMISCAYDNEEDLYGSAECPPEGVSYKETIEPIIQANCAISGCHITGQQSPVLQTYDQIAANARGIRSQTSSGIMPPATSGKKLSPNQVNQIVCWIDAGSPEN